MMEIIEEVIYSRATPFMAWLGPKYFMVIDHPNDIQCVMNAKGCSEKSDIYRFFNAAASLLAAPGTHTNLKFRFGMLCIY